MTLIALKQNVYKLLSTKHQRVTINVIYLNEMLRLGDSINEVIREETIHHIKVVTCFANCGTGERRKVFTRNKRLSANMWLRANNLDEKLGCCESPFREHRTMLRSRE